MGVGHKHAYPTMPRPESVSFFDVPGALVCTADPDGVLTQVGVGWEPALGHPAEAMTGRRFIDFVHPDDVAPTTAVFEAVLAGNKVVEFENRYRTAAGGYRWLRWNAASDPTAETIYAVATDVSSARELQESVSRRALCDQLTGLPNRVLFTDRVDTALAQLARRSSHVAVLLLDVDDFHVVNVTLGRGAGDEVLLELAQRLRRAVRASDTAARVGPDEFAVLYTDIDEAAVLEVAQRIAAELSLPVNVRGRELVLTASIGVAVAETPRVADMLIADADAALRRAIAEGAGRIEIFDRALRAESLARMELQLELRSAIHDGELTLHYQPVIDLTSNDVIAFEALVRWRHPRRGLLAPNLFVPLAEETGLITELGAWVLEAACREAVRWTSDGNPPPAVAVNVSARQLADPDLVYAVARALESTRLPAERLWLEVTETAVLDDLDESLETLGVLDRLGVSIALDDFGEGQSSLSHLEMLTPVSVLKISARFIASADNPRSRGAATVEAVIGLGRSIGLRTVAEGVETSEQLAALRATGCSAAQGFLFARPQPPDEIAALRGGADP